MRWNNNCDVLFLRSAVQLEQSVHDENTNNSLHSIVYYFHPYAFGFDILAIKG